MRLMPFRTADSEAVVIADPVVTCNGSRVEPGQPAVGWDYLSSISVVVAFRIDEQAFLAQTGLTSMDDISVAVQVDCPATGWREVSRQPAKRACEQELVVEAVVPPGVAATSLEIIAFVFYDGPERPAESRRSASRRGSRLFAVDKAWRVRLEGESTEFPVDALDFASIGLPAKAPWHLHISAADLEEPFMRVVRLRINSAHPVAEQLLSAKGPAMSVMFHDVLLQLLLAADPLESNGEVMTDDEESLGAVVESICQTYLGMSLDNALADLRRDRSVFMTRLKDAADLLGQVAKCDI